MKTKFFKGLLYFFVITFFLSGCQKAPKKEINQAKAAVESAQSAEANKYLAEDFQDIKSSMNAALALVESERSKSMFSRDYSESKRLLARVNEMSAQIIENTEEKKAELNKENESLVNQIKDLIGENKLLIQHAPKGKEGKAALDLISQDVSLIEMTVTEVSKLITEGDIISANDKLHAAKEKAVSINIELKEAIAKVKRIRK